MDVDIEDVVIQLSEKSKRAPSQSEAELRSACLEAVEEEISERVFEPRSLAMFLMDDAHAFVIQEKTPVEFIRLALYKSIANSERRLL